MYQVKKAMYVDNYKIKTQFNDNRESVIDLKNTILNDNRKIFQELKDLDKFKNFTIKFDTICWSNDLDLAPEYLYFQAFKNDKTLKPIFEKWGYK